MKQICFSSFAKAKAQSKTRIGLAFLAAAACFGLGVVWLTGLWRIGFSLGGAFCFVLALKVLERAFNAWMGDRGESRVAQTLKDLDDRHLLVQNWLPVGKRGDIDFLLLGPFGAVVIEVKNYAVPIRCNGDCWERQTKGRWIPHKSISRQLTANVRTVAKSLKMPVEGFLVFNNGADLKIAEPSVAILRRRDLLSRIQSLSPAGHDAAELWARLNPEATTASLSDK